jgi:hypothetical protein
MLLAPPHVRTLLQARSPEDLHDPITAAPASDPITVCTGASDGHEGDNAFTSASPIATDGTVQVHNFDVAVNQDWVQFQAVGGQSYTIN